MNNGYVSILNLKIAIYSESLEIFYLNSRHNGYDPDKSTILLLHGYLGSSHDYDPFFERFGDYYNLIAYDLRGHGKSDSPDGEWKIDDLVSDTYQIVRLMVPDGKRIIVVGSSLSTAVSLNFASKYPELIEKLFLISPTTKFTISRMKRFVIKWMGVTPNVIIASSLKLVNWTIPNNQHRKNQAKLAMEKILHIPISVHKKILQATIPSHQVSADHLKIPMMIIAGELDNIVPFNDSVTLNQSAPHSSILILKNTKHHILIKRTNLVMDVFNQWLETQPELLIDVEHYHESDLIIGENGKTILPEEWEQTKCNLVH